MEDLGNFMDFVFFLDGLVTEMGSVGHGEECTGEGAIIQAACHCISTEILLATQITKLTIYYQKNIVIKLMSAHCVVNSAIGNRKTNAEFSKMPLMGHEIRFTLQQLINITTMNNPLQSLMMDFARETGLSTLDAPENDQICLRFDDRYDVNILYDANTHHLHLLSLVEKPSEEIDASILCDWNSINYRHEEFDWAIHWHSASDLLVHRASASLSQLDSIKFFQMMDLFVARLNQDDYGTSQEFLDLHTFS
jgi:hypothetical protein